MVKFKKNSQRNISRDQPNIGSIYTPVDTERKEKHYNISSSQMRGLSMWNDLSTGCFTVSGTCFGIFLNCLISPSPQNEVYRNMGIFFAIVFFLFAIGLRRFRVSELDKLDKDSKPRQ